MILKMKIMHLKNKREHYSSDLMRESSLKVRTGISENHIKEQHDETNPVSSSATNMSRPSFKVIN